MISRSDLKQSLLTVLPFHLHRDAALIAEIIIMIANGSLDLTAIDTQRQSLLKALSANFEGRDISTRDAIISFGKDAQAGDITVRDIAAGNITTINANIVLQSSILRPAYQSRKERAASEMSFIDNYPQGGLVLESRTWKKVNLKSGEQLNIAVINETLIADIFSSIAKHSIKRTKVHIFKNVHERQIPLILQLHNIKMVVLSDRTPGEGSFSPQILLESITRIDSRIFSIVFMSNYEPHEKYKIMRELGADAIFLIPFESSEVENVILDAIPER